VSFLDCWIFAPFLPHPGKFVPFSSNSFDPKEKQNVLIFARNHFAVPQVVRGRPSPLIVRREPHGYFCSEVNNRPSGICATLN